MNMTAVVEEKKTGERYVLLGTGFGAYQSMKEGIFFGDLLPDIDKGQFAMVCVSNGDGKIGWFKSHEVRVITIDGRSPGDLLNNCAFSYYLWGCYSARKSRKIGRPALILWSVSQKIHNNLKLF